jgi:hypothetical protein
MFLPPGIVPPVAQFMSPRLKSPLSSSYQYKIYRKDRKELIDKNDGGVLIMVRPYIKSDECPYLDTECEIKWIEIRPNDKDQILVSVPIVISGDELDMMLHSSVPLFVML